MIAPPDQEALLSTYKADFITFMVRIASCYFSELIMSLDLWFHVGFLSGVIRANRFA